MNPSTNRSTNNPAEEVPRPIRDAITANAETVAEIIGAGDVAVVAYMPDAAWRSALKLGTDAPIIVGKMPGLVRRAMIERGDSVTSRWLRGGRTSRVFAVMHGGSLLLNFAAGGWSVEPGSLDADAS